MFVLESVALVESEKPWKGADDLVQLVCLVLILFVKVLDTVEL